MSEEKPSIAQVLKKNRSKVMALLGVPVIGMLIAVVVIYIKKPDNMIVVYGVILFVAVQYILMMFFFMKRVEAMVEKEETTQKLENEEKPETDEDEVEERIGRIHPLLKPPRDLFLTKAGWCHNFLKYHLMNVQKL